MEMSESRDSAGNSAIFIDDHVQLLARRKALNISTTRQKDPDQPRKVNLISDSSSSYPLLPAAKPSKFIRYSLEELPIAEGSFRVQENHISNSSAGI